MQEEYQTITKENKVYTVQLIKAFDGKGEPFSAFVIFDKKDFQKLDFSKVINLNAYQENILYLKKGHTISKQDEEDVKELIDKYYLNIPYEEENSSKFSDNLNTGSSPVED